MKATGIVRRIDELGRVVIPKEIRRTLRMREGTPLEIYTEKEGELIFKKYSPIAELGDFALEYAESICQFTEHIVIITDMDTIITACGANKKEYIDTPISIDLEKIMHDRKSVISNKLEGATIYPIKRDDINFYTAQIFVPIIGNSECFGMVILASKQEKALFTTAEIKVAQIAASFLASQII
jgi:AbrB family transcriptional regulator (stage V sporulation protein T)